MFSNYRKAICHSLHYWPTLIILTTCTGLMSIVPNLGFRLQHIFTSGQQALVLFGIATGVTNHILPSGRPIFGFLESIEPPMLQFE